MEKEAAVRLDSILKGVKNSGLLVSYNGYKVVSTYAYYYSSIDTKKKYLFGFIDRKNKQWITLQFNSSVLAILAGVREMDGTFISVKVSGKAELLNEDDLYNVYQLITEQSSLSLDTLPFDNFVKKFVMFKILIEEVSEEFEWIQ
jgi:hypothetical protein